MAIQSAQTNYKGQHGWNDLAPGSLDLNAASRAVSGKSRTRRVITPHDSNSLSMDPTTSASSLSRSNSPSLAPPPRVSGVSGASPPPPPMSRPSTPATAAANTPPPSGSIAPPRARTPISRPVSPTTAAANQVDVSLDESHGQSQSLASRPSNLSDSEIQVSCQRVQRQLPDSQAVHKIFIKEVSEIALCDDKMDAKNKLRQYSSDHSNVTVWTVPLRRLIEQQQ